MPVELEEQLVRLGDHYRRVVPSISTSELEMRRRLEAHDGETACSVELENQPPHRLPKPRGRRLITVGVAVTIVAAGVVGFAQIATQPQSLPPTAGDQPPAGSDVIGLFPAGRRDDVVAGGYSSPQGVTQAYLDDRTHPGQLPDGYGAEARVTAELGKPSDGTGGTAIPIDAETALVPFQLETRPEHDTSDGYVLTRSVLGSQGERFWVVIAAATMRFDVELTYRDGALTARYTTGAGGTTSVTTHDPTDASLLAGDLSELPLLAEGEQSGTVDLAVGDHDSVAVRLWNIGNVQDGRLRAVFAEGLIARGETGIHAGWEPLDSLAARSGD